MSAIYPIDSPETTPRPKAALEGIYQDSKLVSAWQAGDIRIEHYKIPSGEVYLAYRSDSGESILQKTVTDLTGPEPVTREMPVDRCFSLWTVIQALAREWGRPLERTWPVDLPADPFLEAFLAARKKTGEGGKHASGM